MKRTAKILSNMKAFREDRAITSAKGIRRFLSPVDQPHFVPAQEAGFMRGDDYVIGMVHEGQSRAYPAWIVDYYHVVNDRIGDQAVALFS